MVMWAKIKEYKQRNKNGDNQLLEKLSVLFIQDWKLYAIVDNNLFWKVEKVDSDSKNGKHRYKQRENVE